MIGVLGHDSVRLCWAGDNLESRTDRQTDRHPHKSRIRTTVFPGVRKASQPAILTQTERTA